MKKKYISPESTLFELQMEGAIALSLTDGEISSEEEIRSNEKGMDDWGGWDD